MTEAFAPQHSGPNIRVRRIPRRVLRQHDGSSSRTRIASCELCITETSAEVSLISKQHPTGEVISRCMHEGFGKLLDYLLSDDTRLLPHPFLKAVAADPAEYETLVGEDRWRVSDKVGEEEDVRVPSVCTAFMVEQWIVAALGAFGGDSSSSSNGVVVCGESSVATDCAWAVSSQSIVVHDARDVMTALRMSSVLSQDFDEQLEAIASASEGTRPSDVVDGDEEEGVRPMQRVLRMSLEEGLSGATVAANEFRLFCKRELSSPSSIQEELHSVHGNGEWYLRPVAASQRSIDVCFPSLSSLGFEQRNDLFLTLSRRVCGGMSPSPSSSSPSSSIKANPPPRFLSEAVMQHVSHISVITANEWMYFDMVYESVSLPVYCLSAATVAVDVVRDEEEVEQTRDDDDDERSSAISVFRLLRSPAAVEAVDKEGCHSPSKICRLFIADSLEDLCSAGHDKHLRGVPLELQRPELFDMPQEMLDALRAARR